MRIRFVLVVAVIAVSVSAAKAADQVTFQLGWLPGGDKAPAFLAKSTGMFAAQNLDVKILSGRGANDVLTKLATGTADVGEVTFDVYADARITQQVPATAVMPLFTKAPDAFVVTKVSGITSFKDLAGKTVASAPISNSLAVLPAVLKMNGVDPTSVKVVKADPAALGPMLATGQVDAILYWTTAAPYLAPALDAAGKSMLVIPWFNYGFEGYSQIIVASDKFLKERSEVAKRFLGVMRDAIRKTADDPNAAVDAVKAAVPQMDQTVIRAQVDAIKSLMVNEVTARDGLGVFTPTLLRKSWEWAALAHGFQSNAVDPASLVDPKVAGF